MENSYIKEHDKETYGFFIEYWSFLKKYYVVNDDGTWWGSFISDVHYYIEKYSYSDFYVDLIMVLYSRNISGPDVHDIKYISAFYKDWWQIFNKYYGPLKERPELQGGFVNEIKDMYEKYKNDAFLIECIDILYNYKMPEVKTVDSLRFVQQIYGLA